MNADHATSIFLDGVQRLIMEVNGLARILENGILGLSAIRYNRCPEIIDITEVIRQPSKAA